MKYSYRKVNPDLTDYVRTVLVLEDCSDPETSALPLFTNGMPALLCKTENTSHQVTLFGQSVPNEKWVVEDNSALIAFFFKPFAIATIFKLSAQELKSSPVALHLWNTQKATVLNKQLLRSVSTKEKTEILNRFILGQIRANQRECKIIQHATDKLMQDPNAEALSQLLRELHLTERTFQRIFKKYVGITPNQYRRICQFYSAFSLLKDGHFDKQTDVAFTSGYFDQSHYIRSFREFTDTTPNEYLQSGLTSQKE